MPQATALGCANGAKLPKQGEQSLAQAAQRTLSSMPKPVRGLTCCWLKARVKADLTWREGEWGGWLVGGNG